MPTQAPLTIHTRLTAHTGFSTPQLGFGNVLEERMDEIVDAALRAGHRMCKFQHVNTLSPHHSLHHCPIIAHRMSDRAMQASQRLKSQSIQPSCTVPSAPSPAPSRASCPCTTSPGATLPS